MRRLIVVAFAVLTIGSTGPSSPSCGPWVSQVNGTSWRMCTDAQGQRYCEIKDGRQIKRMTCP